MLYNGVGHIHIIDSKLCTSHIKGTRVYTLRSHLFIALKMSNSEVMKQSPVDSATVTIK